jgi:hypothetical protein
LKDLFVFFFVEFKCSRLLEAMEREYKKGLLSSAAPDGVGSNSDDFEGGNR